MKSGRLFLRLAVGGFFVGHGTQKLFGWFGGRGIDATATGFEGLGLRPGKPNAIAAGATEAVGGAMLAVGLETPLAASMLTGTMLTAIHRAHWKQGPWATNHGYEYNVVLIGAALALAEVGPGKLSFDAAFGRERTGGRWALAALAAGALGSLAVHALAERQSALAPAADEAPADEPAPPVADAEATTDEAEPTKS